MVYIIIGVVAVALLGYGVVTYNSLVGMRNRVKDQWAQIDVQLKRRFDLIPNLVETVKGYAKHESETFKEVIEARSKFASATNKEEEIEANKKLSSAVTKIFALSESYPDLKANTNFLDMQSTLKDTEDKIAITRQFYNDTVLTLNNKIEMFPSNILANLFKFKKEAFFEVDKKEQENPEVKF